jgi:predicted nucleic acid-binding protein
MTEITFLDVNVFMYSAGAPHPYKDPCVRILSDVETGVLAAAVNTEIFQELLYRYSRNDEK